MMSEARRASSSSHRCLARKPLCLTVTASLVAVMWSVAGIGQLRRCEPVEGANNGGDERVATAVAGIVEDVKLTGAPPLRQLPRGIQRAADVVAAVDQDAGNAVQCRGITEQLVLSEEGRVPPV